MTRFLAILAALSCAASAQTYRTVTADTNNVIRTNFTLGSAQVTGAFAISNTAGLQSALDGKLATNGNAAGLTNFPATLLATNGDAGGLTNFPPLLLTTNSAESAFPAALLRTNGDGSGLTNLPNANLTNATGVLPLANGGTGTTNAALAIEALLPAYTNNEGKVLGLDTNLALIWTTNAGGGGATYTNAEEALNGLGFASSNNNSINLFNNGGTNANDQHTVIGSGASSFGTNIAEEAVVIGAVAKVTNGGVAIGSYAVTENGVAVGPESTADGSSVAIGRLADAQGGSVSVATNAGSVAVGTFAVAFPYQGVAIGSGSQTEGRGIAIGSSSLAQSNATYGGTAVGYNSDALAGGVAIGDNAITTDGVAIGQGASSSGESIAIGPQAYGGLATNAIQIGRGTNANDNTIQFYNAGAVGTNAWKALADSTAFGHLFMSSPTNGTNGQVAALNSNASAIVWTNISASYPSFSGNAAKVLAVASNEAGVEWIAVSNTVTDASSLTNFPTLNQNTTGTASNVTGVVAIANGGSGQTTAAAAIEAFLPAYSGNADRILALNSNATALVWTTNASGGGLPETPLAISNGGSGASTASGALFNLTILRANNSVQIGNSALANNHSTAIGYGAEATGSNSIAIGHGFGAVGARGTKSIAIEGNAEASYAITIGHSTQARSLNSVAIGYDADVNNVGSNNIAFGRSSNIDNATNTVAIGTSTGANASEAVALGAFANIASAQSAAQIGRGTNTNSSTIQFLSAGSVNETKWGYLANASTAGGSRMTNTNGVTVTNTIIGYDGTNYTTNTITVIDGIIASWTQ